MHPAWESAELENDRRTAPALARQSEANLSKKGRVLATDVPVRAAETGAMEESVIFSLLPGRSPIGGWPTEAAVCDSGAELC